MTRIKFKHDHWLFQVEPVCPNTWAGASCPSSLPKVSDLLQKLTFFFKVFWLFSPKFSIWVVRMAFLFFSMCVIEELEELHDYLNRCKQLSILNLHTKLVWLPWPDFCKQDRSSFPPVAVIPLVAGVVFRMFSARVKTSASIISQPSLNKIPDPGNKWACFYSVLFLFRLIALTMKRKFIKAKLTSSHCFCCGVRHQFSKAGEIQLGASLWSEFGLAAKVVHFS